MMDGVRRQHALALIKVIPASIQISFESWKITTGDFDTDAVSRCESVAGYHGTDVHFIHITRLHKDGILPAISPTHALYGLVEVVSRAVRVNIEQLDSQISVPGVRRQVE